MIEKPSKDVLLIAALDTKEDVAKYIKARLEEHDKSVLVLDCSTGRGKTNFVPDVSRANIAEAAGKDYEEVSSSNQFDAGTIMIEGIKQIVRKLFEEERFKAVIGVGGSNGTLIATAGMRELPVGVPKIIISAMACGTVQFGPYVGLKDIIIVPSVADILGINPISKRIIDNAVGALVGMLGVEVRPSAVEQIALTMLGQTTPAGMAGREVLEKEGFSVVAFHPNGVGGAAMEEFVAQNVFSAVWELTPHEVGDELLSKTHSAGPDRMRNAGLLGIPQVVVPGGCDFFYGSPEAPDMLLSRYPDRQTYPINDQIILIKLSRDEAIMVAEVLAQKMNQSTGPVSLAIPTRGISRYDRPEYPFYNPEIDAVLFSQLKKRLLPHIPVIEMDAHISDLEVGINCAKILLEMLKEYKREKS